MLNTSSIRNKKDNADLSVINKGMRKIEEKTADYQFDNDIIKSFHSMESKIFSNMGTENETNPQNEQVRKDFNLNEITQKYSDEEYSKNIFNKDKKLLISINKKLNQFSVFTENNEPIGYFNVLHIIKYLGDVYDTKKQFLREVDDKSFQKAKELVKVLIFKIKYNPENKYTDIVLLNYTQSGFLGDVDLLIKLNDQLYKYQERLHSDLAKVDMDNRIKIELNIKKFIFILLNYTLQLISIISEKIKDKEDKRALKEKLVNYSIAIVYRINIFVQEQLKIIDKQNKSIKESINMNMEMKKDLDEKLNKIMKKGSNIGSVHKVGMISDSDTNIMNQLYEVDVSDDSIKRIIYEA